MLSKSLVVQALLQIFSRTVLDVTPIYALPTGEPVLRRSTDPPGGDYSPQWQKCGSFTYFRRLNDLPNIVHRLPSHGSPSWNQFHSREQLRGEYCRSTPSIPGRQSILLGI